MSDKISIIRMRQISIIFVISGNEIILDLFTRLYHLTYGTRGKQG